MDATEKIAQSRDKLISDLRIVVRDAEELLANTGEQAGEGYKIAKAKIEASLQTAKEELARVQDTALVRVKEAATTTDEYVKAHPWQAVGFGAALGVILGFLISRK
ncbi:MAG: hypothetical protein H6R01_502 [Burkholderiaceae bacterium]|nr:hypothetical protein [Burkholderiaceae bacterium]